MKISGDLSDFSPFKILRRGRRKPMTTPYDNNNYYNKFTFFYRKTHAHTRTIRRVFTVIIIYTSRLPGARFPKDNASSAAYRVLLRVFPAHATPPYTAEGEVAAPRDRCTENYTVRACPTTPGGSHAISSTADAYMIIIIF